MYQKLQHLFNIHLVSNFPKKEKEYIFILNIDPLPLIGSLNDGGVLSVTSKSSSSKSCTLPSLTSTKRKLINLKKRIKLK
jgi:hypothetical protein